MWNLFVKRQSSIRIHIALRELLEQWQCARPLPETKACDAVGGAFRLKWREGVAHEEVGLKEKPTQLSGGPADFQFSVRPPADPTAAEDCQRLSSLLWTLQMRYDSFFAMSKGGVWVVKSQRFCKALSI
jgi:hypothetical protein